MSNHPRSWILLGWLGLFSILSAEPAADWQLKNSTGQAVKLSDYKGKVVLIDFWASWCAPCQAEIPTLVSLQNSYGGAGLQIIGLSEDKADPSILSETVKRTRINYPIAFASSEVISNYHAQSLPTLILIDQEGQIQAHHMGQVTQATLEGEIAKLLHVSVANSGPSMADLKSKLTPEQFDVTQQCGTEPPFANAYWNNHGEGIYVDIVNGQALFCSKDKFDSGTGWPSFTQPIEKEVVKEKSDGSAGMDRTEVRSAQADSHLGHVFNDGPGPSGNALLHQFGRPPVYPER